MGGQFKVLAQMEKLRSLIENYSIYVYPRLEAKEERLNQKFRIKKPSSRFITLMRQ
jgi:hypothetical protein